MQKPVDAFGEELSPGKFITYAVRQSSSMDIRAGIILDVLDKGEGSWNRFSIRILAYSPNHSYVLGEGYIPGVYNAVLTSNDTLVVVDSLPLYITVILNIAYYGNDTE